MHYSVDFRKRVLEYVNTHTLNKTAETFGIAARTISLWKKLLKETGKLKDPPLSRKPRKLNYEKLIEYVKAHPDAYLREIAEEFGVVIETIRKALMKLGFTLKKRPKYTKNGMSRGERSISKKYQSTSQKT